GEIGYFSRSSHSQKINDLAFVQGQLTPVSVAGVARRTTRRCAAGVYNC
ncbi:hypothetical protein GOD36_25685, partial [Sinorhizobium medicae]|nr:hypothetical protein [Sinorhizobium medicae]MDX0827029.1 hypothetical protein [Sinorhizobium medicae]